MERGGIERTPKESKSEQPFQENAYAFFEQCREEARAIEVALDRQGRLLAPDGVTISAYEKLRLQSSHPSVSLETDPGILIAKIVRTKLFRSRFGDWMHGSPDSSKVVYPETGEPMVVFHGTTHIIPPGQGIQDINKKGRIFLSSEIGTPAQFANLDREPGGTIHPYFAVIRKPVAEDRRERDGIIGAPGKETIAVFSAEQLIALPISFQAESPHEAIRFLRSF